MNKIDTLTELIHYKILYNYEFVKSSSYARHITSLSLYKSPKRDNKIVNYQMNMNITNSFDINDNHKDINLYNKKEMLTIIKKAFNSTLRIFDYDEEIETSLGIYDGKLISIKLFKDNG